MYHWEVVTEKIIFLQQDVSLMESEETSEGGTTPPGASSITGEAWDSSAMEGEYHATHIAAEMSTSPSNSAKVPELSTPKDCLAAPGKAAEMLGRPSNSMQKVPAGLEQGQRDTEPQKELSELEGEMLLEEGGLDYSLKLRQLELVDLESNQGPSSHSRVEDEPAPSSPVLQAVKLSTEFPQCQAELAFHGSDPQAQETKSPLADAIASQKDTPKCFLVCKTVSEGHYKAEPFLDSILKDSLQEVDAGAEQEQSTRKLAPAPDEQPTSEGAVEDTTKPYTSEDVQESLRAPQGLEKNTESFSSHQLTSTLTCDSHMSSLQAEGNNSSGETGNTVMVNDQGMVPKKNSSASKCLHLEDDHRKTEGRPAPSTKNAFQGKSNSKRTEEVNASWHKEPAWEEAVSELQQEEEEEECKEQNMLEEGKPLELKNQKNKEQNEQKQLQREELRLREELKLEALSSAFGSEIPSVPRHNVDVCGLEFASLSEQTGSVFLPGELVSVDQHPGEDVLLKAHVTETDSGCQPPAVGPLSSNNQNPGGEAPHMCYVSDQAEDLEDSGRFSIGGQDIGEAHWDDKKRLGRENEHSDDYGKAVQRFDKRDASLCGGVTAPFSAENLESLVPAHPSSGTNNLEPPDHIDLHPITGKAELWDFIPASPSEITSAVSASVPEQDGGRIASVTSEHCPGTSLSKLPDFAGKPPKQAAPAQEWNPTPAETAVVRTGTREAKTSHELLTSEEGFPEDLSGPSSFSVMYTSSLPLQGGFPGDRRSVASIAGPLEVSQTPGRTSTPLIHPETIQQISPQKSAIIQGKEMAADVDCKAQVPLFDEPDCSLYQKEPGSRISSVLSTLTWPSEDDTVLAVNQQGQPLYPVSHSSLPLVSEPDAKELPHPPPRVQRPSQAQAPALHANHLVSPPVPEGHQLLAPGLHSRPHLSCGMDDGKLGAIHPAPSHPLRTAASAFHTSSVASASDGESLAERDDLIPVSGVWDLGDSGPHDTETSDDSGVSLLTKSFLALGNEMLVGCSDTSPETADHDMDIESGKSSPDHPSWPSLEGLITSPDSKHRESAQLLPMLAFTNPIHFLRLSPPSVLTTRTTCQDKELQWEQPTGSFSGDTKNIQAPLAVTEKTEGERRVRQRLEGEHQPKEEKAKHAPLEKSSSWPDKKTIGVAMQDPAGNQENPLKSRVKTKDWHRQGLKRMSVPPDILQRESSLPFPFLLPPSNLEQLSRSRIKLNKQYDGEA